MLALDRLQRRIRIWLNKDSVDHEMDAEMRFHLEMEARELVRDGMSAEDARRSAALGFGGVERFKEQSRSARGGRAPEELLADVRYALRALRRTPAFSIAAILTLALGIGATSAVFSVVDGVLLRPLPYAAPEQLVRIFEQNSPTNRFNTSVADLQGIREHQHAFSAVGAVMRKDMALTGGERPEWARGVLVTPSLFRVLGTNVAEGRIFRDEEEQPGSARVVVVTRAFKDRHFGSEASALGKTLVLDRVPHTVVGVLPAGVKDLAGFRADMFPALQVGPPQRRGPFLFTTIARMRPGVTLAGAQRDLANVSTRLMPLYSDWKDAKALLIPMSLHEAITGRARVSLGMFFAAVALVLMIGVANVANLTLVRAAGRKREMAVRSALGAGRARLARMLLTESVVVALIGGLLGLDIAWLSIRTLARIGPNIPRIDQVQLDVRVVGFTLMLALISGALVGAYPLLFSTRDVATPLRSSERRVSGGRSAQAFQSALLVAEFALALPLLVAAGLLLNSFVNLQNVNPGFDPANVTAVHMSLPAKSYPDQLARSQFAKEIQRRIADMPGVQSVGLTTALPPDEGSEDNFDLVDKPVEPGLQEPVAPWSSVTSEFFTTLHLPLIQGRVFNERDDSAAAGVIAVSQSWARHFYPHESAVGKSLYQGGCRPPTCTALTIVGVVADVPYEGLGGTADAVYAPYDQQGGNQTSLVIRSTLPLPKLVAVVRDHIHAMDPQLPIGEAQTMESRLENSLAEPRRRVVVLGSFGGAAVLLAAIGVFGVMSYVVGQRRQEIGVRIALGATASAVIGMVVKRGMSRALAGLIVGLIIALAATRLLKTALFGVSATDLLTITSVCALLLAVAFVACYIPGYRATRIDPIRAISSE
jgi:predicted permease